MKLIDTLSRRLEEGKLPPPHATLVVAVSGGVDSVALLHLLVYLATKYDWRLVVAHLNHQLRREAAADAQWVKKLGSHLGLPVVMAAVKVKEMARQKKMTVEEAGRVARYDFLNKVAKRYRAKAIVVAHTADDQVETAIMNWLRGAGVRGLSGMRQWEHLALRGNRPGGGKLWRPLLGTDKAELRQLAKTLHFGYREDISNQKLDYTRNRVRHQILPLLTKINPRIKEAVLRNANNLAGLEELLDAAVIQARRLVKCRRGWGKISWRLTPFLRLPTYLQNELLLWAVGEMQGHRQGYKTVHLVEMYKVINAQSRRSFRQLPGKLFLLKAYDKISVSRIKPSNL